MKNNKKETKLVALPKEILSNCGCNINDKDIRMDVKLVQKNSEKFIKLIPHCKTINGEQSK
jgi:hypothetical protein